MMREHLHHLGAPPPLISPKPQHPPPSTTLWNPASFVDSNPEPRRAHEPLHPGHYEHARQALSLVKGERLYSSEKLDESAKRKEMAEKYQPVRGPGAHEQGGHSYGTFLAELEKSAQTILNQQRASLSLPSQYNELSASRKASSSPYRNHQGAPRGPDPMLVYDEFLQQQRRLVSKLDLEEKRRREAREKGYYYDLDDSYDESDEEEVRAHLQRVAEQPPLKLDESSEKTGFLQVFGLTTRSHKEEMLEQKRRKRRRMLRERSPSPPAIQNKRQTPPPPPPLSTRYTADQMNCSAELEEKKRFLTMFSLSHVNTHQRKDNEKVVELLQAIKQKSVTLDSIKHSPRPLCKSPAAPPTVNQTTFHPLSDSEMPPSARPSTPSLPDTQKAMDTSKQEQLRPSEVPRPKEVAAAVPTFPGGDKARLGEGHSVKKNTSLLNSIRAQNAPKEASQSQNGRIKPWESFTAEEFAHQFHESVLQSTQKALQKHKGSAARQISEPNHKLDSLVHYNIPELQSSVRAPHPQHNGQHNTIAARKELTVVREEESEEEEETEEEEEEDEEAPRPKWQGIEAIFEAYQEYIDEHSIERQVLQSQCRRLEAHHYNLSLTAEQLSHSMGELMSQKQKLASEREKLQAELDHLRKCLAQPQMHWSRGYFKGYPPR